jgi:hypothetical protein
MGNSEVENRENSEKQKVVATIDVSLTYLCILFIPLILLIALSVLSWRNAEVYKVGKVDARVNTVMETLLNLQARIDALEKENQVLFKMLRNENGLISDSVTPPPVNLTPVLPLPRRIGDTLGDAPLGDAPQPLTNLKQ